MSDDKEEKPTPPWLPHYDWGNWNQRWGKTLPPPPKKKEKKNGS